MKIEKGDVVNVTLRNKYPKKSTYKASVLKTPPFEREVAGRTITEDKYKLKIMNEDKEQIYFATQTKISKIKTGETR